MVSPRKQLLKIKHIENMDTSTSTLVKPVSKILTDDLNDSADGRAAERSARIGTPQPRCGDDPFLELGMRYAATWKFSSSCKWIYGVFPRLGVPQ